MNDYIDKQMLLGTIADNCFATEDAEEFEFWDRAWKFINSFPTADDTEDLSKPKIIETFDGYKIRQLEGIRDILRNRKIRPEDLNNFWKAFQLGVDTCQKQLLSINEDVSEEIGRNIQLLLKIGKKEDE